METLAVKESVDLAGADPATVRALWERAGA
jgi:hypothetical protein